MWRLGVIVAVLALGAGTASGSAVQASFQVRLPGHTSQFLTDPEGLAALTGDAYGLSWKGGTLSIVSSNGAMTRVVAQVPTQILFAGWSPDKRAIVFETLDNAYCASLPPPCGRFQVWTVRRDGSAQTLVRDDAAQPSWSPDSQRLAFVDGFDVSTFTGIVATANADGSGFQELTPRGPVFGPAWSPDARWIAYRYAARRDRRAEIRIADTTGTQPIRTLGRGERAVWAPHADQVALVRYVAPGRQALLVRALAAPRAAVVATAREINGVVWSHSGRSLAFVFAGRPLSTSVGVVGSDGRGRVTIVPPRGWTHGDVYDLAWSHDDTTLYYAVRVYGCCLP